ncbi:MAG TPA: hypothetical protein VKB53_05610 [Gammaproteobacteria bacterium]|nr:hypothetical protein [Gammaproteobacteria bacterium]
MCQAEQNAKAAALPDDGHRVLYAGPPWKYGSNDLNRYKQSPTGSLSLRQSSYNPLLRLAKPGTVIPRRCVHFVVVD